MTPVAYPKEIHRRAYLAASAGLMGSFVLSSAYAQPARVKASSWIDAHVHIWPSYSREYPLADGFGPEVIQPQSFTTEQLFEQSRPSGVSRIVLIQMNFFGFDNQYMLDAIARHPGTFSGVAVIDHERLDLKDEMARLRPLGVRGFRIYATADNVNRWLTSAAMADMFSYAADHGQAMCMLADPDALGDIEILCSRHSNTTIVIDHFGRIGMRHPPTEEEIMQLCQLARFPKVFVKTSAFYALGRKSPPYYDLLPLIRRLIEAFGSDRLMWASDCPYQVESPHTYEGSIALIRDHLDQIGDADRQNLLRKTAENVFFGA